MQKKKVIKSSPQARLLPTPATSPPGLMSGSQGLHTGSDFPPSPQSKSLSIFFLPSEVLGPEDPLVMESSPLFYQCGNWGPERGRNHLALIRVCLWLQRNLRGSSTLLLSPLFVDLGTCSEDHEMDVGVAKERAAGHNPSGRGYVMCSLASEASTPRDTLCHLLSMPHMGWRTRCGHVSWSPSGSKLSLTSLPRWGEWEGEIEVG